MGCTKNTTEAVHDSVDDPYRRSNRSVQPPWLRGSVVNARAKCEAVFAKRARSVGNYTA